MVIISTFIPASTLGSFDSLWIVRITCPLSLRSRISPGLVILLKEVTKKLVEGESTARWEPFAKVNLAIPVPLKFTLYK